MSRECVESLFEAPATAQVPIALLLLCDQDMKGLEPWRLGCVAMYVPTSHCSLPQMLQVRDTSGGSRRGPTAKSARFRIKKGGNRPQTDAKKMQFG